MRILSGMPAPAAAARNARYDAINEAAGRKPGGLFLRVPHRLFVISLAFD